MFAGWKVAVVVGLAGVLAGGYLYVQLTNAKADIVRKDARITQVEGVNTRLNAQLTAVQAALEDEKKATAFERARANASDAALAKLDAEKDAIQDQLQRVIAHVKNQDDGPAAPVLEYAANSLRWTSEAIAAVRAGDDREKGLSAGADSLGLGDDLPASRGTWPRTQAEFAELAINFGAYALTCTKKLAGIDAWAEGENRLIAEANR